jgi:hypothetical protein
MSDDTKTSSKHRTIVIIVVALLIGGIILLYAVERGSIVAPPAPPPADPAKPGAQFTPVPPPTGPKAAHVEPKPAPGPTAVRAFGSGTDAPPEPIPGFRSALADGLNTSDGEVRRDLQIVEDLFSHYLGELRELPVGNNAEITAALAGDNRRAYAILPPDHRAINANGELVDRWGTPFFFHQLSSNLMEIRSAGPDRRRATADDAVWPPETTSLDAGAVADAGM